MKNQLTFYVCSHCGNVVQKLHDSGVELVCCGEPMKTLTPNTQDAAVEKHLPVAEASGTSLRVQVGSTLHPALPEHHIGWILLECESDLHFAMLQPGDEPSATFELGACKPVAAYAWCNLHGLWKTEI